MKSPNISASIRQRLLNHARSSNRPFGEILQYYAMERFLYRLSQSPHANQFILKGALLLKIWHSLEFRPTMDIDMLGRTSNDDSNVISMIRDIIAVDVEPDGISFVPDTIQTERIAEDADYAGIRALFRGKLDTAKINMRLDIGFGDIVYPAPEESFLPSMLDLPAPRLLCYSRESAVAEKFEAIVKFGVLNSRMKDFYDIWALARQFDFDAAKLAGAIHATFQKRGTLLSLEIEAFKQAFVDAKQVQWTAFRKRLGYAHVPESFKDIVSVVENFLAPIIVSDHKTLRNLHDGQLQANGFDD